MHGRYDRKNNQNAYSSTVAEVNFPWDSQKQLPILNRRAHLYNFTLLLLKDGPGPRNLRRRISQRHRHHDWRPLYHGFR